LYCRKIDKDYSLILKLRGG